MSSQEVKHVLNKIFTDEDFRTQFTAAPDTVLQDLDLTDHEKSMLTELNLTDIEDSDLVTAHLMDQSAIRVGAVYVT